ncbi:MAG: putative rane protein [Pseudomonadota bacterium]|jgi:hypothetical protein
MPEFSGVPPGVPIIQAIERLPLALAMRESTWLYPTVETLHILGIAGLFGTVLLLDVRLLGLGKSIPLSPLVRLILPIAFVSLLLVMLSGSLLFLTQAGELIALPLFAYKIALIMVLLTNATALHLRIGPLLVKSEIQQGFPWSIRLQAGASVLGWIVVVWLGRWLAYV